MRWVWKTAGWRAGFRRHRHGGRKPGGPPVSPLRRELMDGRRRGGGSRVLFLRGVTGAVAKIADVVVRGFDGGELARHDIAGERLVDLFAGVAIGGDGGVFAADEGGLRDVRVERLRKPNAFAR